MDLGVLFAMVVAAAVGFAAGAVFVYRIAVQAIEEGIDDFYSGRRERYEKLTSRSR